MGIRYLRECTVLMIATNVTTAARDRGHECHLNCFLCGTLPLPHRAAPFKHRWTGSVGLSCIQTYSVHGRRMVM